MIVLVFWFASGVVPVHGDQEGAGRNGHFQSTCLHPVFLFNQCGDQERCVPQPGKV